MTLYHGTHSAALKNIQKVGIQFDQNPHPGDFGTGFYLTTSYSQASRWAIRKADTENRRILHQSGETNELVSPVVIEYKLDKTYRSTCNFLHFDKPNNSWKNFVYNCRMSFDHVQYDLVIGPMADGFNPMLISSMTRQQFHQIVNVNGQQVVICSQRALQFLSERGLYYVLDKTRKTQ